MADLKRVAESFVKMAHSIVWCSAATVDPKGRPRSRVLHPIWQWDGESLVGWIATNPNSVKRAHLQLNPHISLHYWAPNHDTCTAECRATWCLDDDSRKRLWERFKSTPEPLGYDPARIPIWKAPTDDNFAALRVDPWRLRVFPGTVLLRQGGEVLNWQASAARP